MSGPTEHVCTCGDCSPDWTDRCKYEADANALRARVLELKTALRPFATFAQLEDDAHAGHAAESRTEVLRSSQVGPVYKTLTVADFRLARTVIERVI